MESAQSGKKGKYVVLGICALMIVIWGVLIAFVFRGSNEKENGSIWVLKENQQTRYESHFSEKEGGIVKQYGTCEYKYEYDSNGRLTKESYYSGTRLEWTYDLEYYYDGETPITRVTMTDYDYRRTSTEPEIREREEHEYDPAGKIRSHAKYWDNESQSYAKRTFYDTDRHETGSISYDQDGNIDGKTRYHRDVNGYEISCETWTPEDDEWTPVQTRKSECDSEGRVRKQYEFRKDEWWLTREVKYYDDGTWLQTEYKQVPDKQDKSKQNTYVALSYRFDAKGRYREVIEYNYWSKDEPFVNRRYTYEYANDGYTERVEYDSGSVYINIYDRDDRLISANGTDAKGEVFYVEQNIYGEDGRILKERSSKDGVEFTETIYRYDQQGNLIFYGSASDESDGTYYEYDPYGNLLREWLASDEEEGTSYQYEKIRLTKEQREENKKFYTADPMEMDRIIAYR